MAAIGLSARAVFVTAVLVSLGGQARGVDQVSAAARAQLNYVASALTAGDAADAMTPFAKSFPRRETLAGYFSGLTGSYSISNEIDFLDEQDQPAECKLTVRWAITLTSLENNSGEHRSGELTARLIPEKGKWKIVSLEPLTLFDPAGGKDESVPRPSSESGFVKASRLE